MTGQVIEAAAEGAATTVHSRIGIKERMLSLDVFRGFTILGMVFVNSIPGRFYPGLGHAAWNGWGFADLIFPFFVFIVGVAIPYSFAKRLARGESRRKLIWHVVRRCLLLFAIGVFLNGFPKFDLATLRIMNVLQRIAICYFLAVIIYVFGRVETKSIVRLCAAILVLYFVLLKFVPVPGYGAGVLEPVGNWANYIDQHVMPGHMQHKLYEGKTLLGSFPALVTMLIGLLTGIYLRSELPIYEKLVHLYFYGCVSMAAGVIWSVWFPINQQLWTSSLVLFMGGMALVGLATCYYIVDVRKRTWWTLPFLIYGANSLAVWVFSVLGEGILKKVTVPYEGAVVSWWTAGNGVLSQYLGKMNGPLAFGALYDLFWLGIMGIFYWRRIFIKL